MQPATRDLGRGRFDVVIVGGGPGGLSAALVLGRARRRVLVCDSGQYRNAVSHALHGFLSRDGTPPSELLRLGRDEIARYGVDLLVGEVVDATHAEGGFALSLRDGTHVWGRKVILATGVVDELPAVDGFERLYGWRVFHCPYCDGWEHRDAPLAAYGKGDDKGAGLALELTQWTPDIVLCTDGPGGLSREYRERLAARHIGVREEAITRVEEVGESVRIVFADGSSFGRQAIFFNTGSHQRSDLAKRLGCPEWEPDGSRVDDRAGRTKVRGVYVVGDATRDALQVIVAAGQGSAAAIAVNGELLHDDGVL